MKTLYFLKISAEENLVWAKEQNMFYLARKTQEFCMGYMTTRHTALLHCL
jgi:hypothetical protein